MDYQFSTEHELFLSNILGNIPPKIHGEKYLRSRMKRMVEAPFLATAFTPAASVALLFGAIVLLAEKRKSIRDFGHNIHPDNVFTPKFKIVTMCEEAELQEGKLANDAGFKTIRGFNRDNFNDPRVTRLGKILRPLRLDETPQIFNVVSGKVDLIGPRMFSKTEMEWVMNQNVTPYKEFVDHLYGGSRYGLYCLPELIGKGCSVSLDDAVAMNVRYFEKASWLADLKMLTLPYVLSLYIKDFCHKNDK
ncbi:MAG: sugar transferase [Patescibacteria group bacterium]